MAAKDRLLDRLFKTAKLGALENSESNVVQAQRKWLTERNTYCGKNLDKKCISRAYDERLYELAVSDLFADHDAALAEIGRQYPNLVDVYKAMYAYATIQDPSKRQDAVAAYIAPAYKGAVLDSKNESLRSLLKDVPDVKSIASSADTLGAFFWIVSAGNSDYTGRSDALLIPCGVITRKPEAIIWLESRWGGSIDGLSPRSDCVEAMPPLPSYAALKARVDASDSSDTGTMRFSVGADEGAEYAAALTDSLKYFLKEQYGKERRTNSMIAFKKKYAQLIDQANQGLADYYQQYLHTPPEQAKRNAKIAVSSLIGNIY